MTTIEPARTVEQNPAGRKKLVTWLLESGHDPAQTLVVMEATSTYWMQPAIHVYRAGFAVSVVNPRQAHHFAKALNKQAKTDAIDAQTLAQLAVSMQPRCWQPPTEAWEALYQRLVEHDNLVEMRQMLRNQLHAMRHRIQPDAAVVARKQQLLDETQQQVKTVARELGQWLRKSEWSDMARRLQTIKGIGLYSAAWLLVITNGFTTCQDAQQLASYLGLVPHPQHSGSNRRAYRPTGHGGHNRARRVLYQASVSASRYNVIVKPFYDRLIANGKLVKVARVAATRKLVHISFAIATTGQVYDPDYQRFHPQLALAA